MKKDAGLFVMPCIIMTMKGDNVNDKRLSKDADSLNIRNLCCKTNWKPISIKKRGIMVFVWKSWLTVFSENSCQGRTDMG
jgi:hypothetical protein